MLVDAIRAEGFRLLRNRVVLFWSLVFPQLLFLAGAVIAFSMTKAQVGGSPEANAKKQAAMSSTGVHR